MATRVRLDRELVRRGLAPSREAAGAAIRAGRVLVGGAVAAKPSTLVSAADGAAVTKALAAFPDAKALTKSAYIDKTTADIDSLLAIFYVLLALAVIVSLFGIVNTLVLSTFERTRELGTLRAVGMTRRQVRRMVRHESVITALIGAGLGIAVGLGLAVIVTSVFSDEGLTFAVPAGSLIVLTIVAALAGVLAAIVPARRASRLDVLTALAYE